MALLGWHAPAFAGGCGQPATHSTGTTVAITKACFTPSLLSVDAGATVTFVNRDPFVHNVEGQLWGHFDDLQPGQRFQATFDGEGIYPFACTLHPGMTGAVVVGDGVGTGNGESVAVSSDLSKLSEPSVPAPIAAGAIDQQNGSALPAIVVALLVGLAIGAVGATYRSRSAAGITPRSGRP
jgi:plastocyanin